MFAGALAALGAYEDGVVFRQMRSLSCSGEFSLEVQPVLKRGIAATSFRVNVLVPPRLPAGEPTRGITEIGRMIEAAQWPEPVTRRVMAVFRRLAVAEAKIHGVAEEEVHFHEVGAVDAIADISAVCLGLAHLECVSVTSSVPVDGSGTVSCSHGVLPIPVPATLELLRGIPVQACAVPFEMITPTGAALLAEFASSYGSAPALSLEKIGYGAGSRELPDRANVLRAYLGHTLSETREESVFCLEANLDDAQPQLLADALEQLMKAGALDVTIAPVLMKKGRPAHVLSVLCRPEDRERLADEILLSTPSFGVRFYECQRRVLERDMVEVPTCFGLIAIKLGRLRGELLQASPEYESVRLAAERTGKPWRVVWAEAFSSAQGFLRSQR